MTDEDKKGIMAYLKIISEFSRNKILYDFQIKPNDNAIKQFIYNPAYELADIYDGLISQFITFNNKIIDSIKQHSNSIWFGNDRITDIKENFPRDNIQSLNRNSYIEVCDYLSIEPKPFINIDEITKIAGNIEDRLGKVRCNE